MIFVGRANSPLAPVESITKGCQPTDGGNLIIEEEDYEEFINQEPQAQKYIKRLYGAVEFINNKIQEIDDIFKDDAKKSTFEN